MNTQPINTPDPGRPINVGSGGRARGDQPAELDPGMVERAGQSVRERLDTFWPELEDETPQTPDDGAIPEGLDDCAWDIARAALTAAGVSALAAEVERLRYDLDHSYSQREWSALTARATSAEQERDDLKAVIGDAANLLLDARDGDEAVEKAWNRLNAALLAGSGEQPAPTALVRVEWGVVLDDLGSTDVYDTREEAEARAGRDNTVVRIETWRVGSGEQPGEDDRHPESYCHRCGGPNITWWAPSPVWNRVMGYPDEAHDGIVCPLCFAELAEAKGAGEGWRVEPGRWPEGVSLVHTDGRVWDDRAGLWVDPAPVVPDSTDVVREDEDGLLPIEQSLASALWDRWADPEGMAFVVIKDDPRTVARGLREWLRAVVGQGVTAGCDDREPHTDCEPHLTVWADGATAEQREAIYEAAMGAAFTAAEGMDGVDVGGVGTLAAVRPTGQEQGGE